MQASSVASFAWISAPNPKLASLPACFSLRKPCVLLSWLQPCLLALQTVQKLVLVGSDCLHAGHAHSYLQLPGHSSCQVDTVC